MLTHLSDGQDKLAHCKIVISDKNSMIIIKVALNFRLVVRVPLRRFFRRLLWIPHRGNVLIPTFCRQGKCVGSTHMIQNQSHFQKKTAAPSAADRIGKTASPQLQDQGQANEHIIIAAQFHSIINFDCTLLEKRCFAHKKY